MSTGELVGLVVGSVLVIAVGTGIAWIKRPPVAPAEAPPVIAPAAANPFDRFDELAPLPKELGFIDQWRFDSCMTEAAKNPTAHGVNVASRVCRRRFEQ